MNKSSTEQTNPGVLDELKTPPPCERRGLGFTTPAVSQGRQAVVLTNFLCYWMMLPISKVTSVTPTITTTWSALPSPL